MISCIVSQTGWSIDYVLDLTLDRAQMLFDFWNGKQTKEQKKKTSMQDIELFAMKLGKTVNKKV